MVQVLVREPLSRQRARTLKLLIQKEHTMNTALEITSVSSMKQAATEQLTNKTGKAVRNLDQPALRGRTNFATYSAHAKLSVRTLRSLGP